MTKQWKEQENPLNDNKAYFLMKLYAIIIIAILIIGVLLAYIIKNFAAVPFAVVIMGIIAFFGVLRISKALTGSEHGMRMAITVSILVVYLGLLPTLAFQGILQFDITGNATNPSDVTILNQTDNQTVLQVTPKDVSLYETVVTSFTALVAAVLLFYFGSGPLDSYYGFLKAKQEESSGSSSTNTPTDQAKPEEAAADKEKVDPTALEKEITVFKYDNKGNCVEKTVTTERTKKIE